MRVYYDYLNDVDFLKQVAGFHISEYYVLITVLDWSENAIQEIQGRVISGSFNIDGQSSLRRTANFSMMADKMISNLDNIENLISINKKINVQIGYENMTKKYQDYPILWFPLGVYVISSVSISHSDSGLLVSIQGQDKMCLLNGDCGGTFPASVVFDSYETLGDEGEWVIQRPTIYQIIRELVNHFGGQQLNKIVISDLDTRVKQVMKWTGSSPLYFLKSGTQYYMTTAAADYQEHLQEGWKDIDGSPFEYGTDVGFIFTDFSYPGELIANAGQSVVTILEKIKSVLGNYEFFYDVNGNFIFQQIKNFLNNSQSKYIIDALNNNQLVPDYLSSAFPSGQAYLLDASKGRSIFEFNDSNLVSSYNNNPQYSMIKNDFIVWGVRKNLDGIQIPIRYHLAIDSKPKPGNTYYAVQYTDPDDGIDKWHTPIKFSSIEKFPRQGAAGVFYMDQSSEIIYKWDAVEDIYQYVPIDASLSRVTTNDWRSELYFQGVTAEPYGTESNFYYTELLNEWPKLFDIEPDYYLDGSVAYQNVYVCTSNQFNEILSVEGRYYYNIDTKTIYYCKESGREFDEDHFVAQDMIDIDISSSDIWSGNTIDFHYKTGWQNHSALKQEVIKNPTQIDYYLDFIDTSSKFAEFKVNNIGRRTKVLDEGESVNCIFEPWIPDVILIGIGTSQKSTSDMEKLRQECRARGQDWYQVSDDIYSRLAIGGTMNSGYQVIRQVLHQNTSYNETISIQTLPLYHLEPNTRITVNDNDSNIYGDYMINSLSFSLDNSSSLTINASRALERI